MRIAAPVSNTSKAKAGTSNKYTILVIEETISKTIAKTAAVKKLLLDRKTAQEMESTKHNRVIGSDKGEEAL